MSVSTYRKTLQSDILDFVRKINPPQRTFFEDTIPMIVSQLLFYREEGKFLYPDVYMMVDESALKILPGYQKYKISEGDVDDKEIVKKAIKKCAPLCESRWSIYMLIIGNKIEYGLFSAIENVTSVHREDAIQNNETEAPIVISIRIMRDRLISVRARDERLFIYFDVTDENNVDNIEESQQRFISSIVSTVNAEKTESVINFLRRLLTHIYRYGHGTLACVIDKDTQAEDLFKDGIILSNSIELAADYSESPQTGTSFLEGAFELISGMMQSDGITVFTNDGKVKAYNVFLEVGGKTSGKENVSGGARSRAYEALCQTEGVIAAYMQSQDGKIQIKDR